MRVKFTHVNDGTEITFPKKDVYKTYEGWRVTRWALHPGVDLFFTEMVWIYSEFELPKK